MLPAFSGVLNTNNSPFLSGSKINIRPDKGNTLPHPVESKVLKRPNCTQSETNRFEVTMAERIIPHSYFLAVAFLAGFLAAFFTTFFAAGFLAAFFTTFFATGFLAAFFTTFFAAFFTTFFAVAVIR